MAETTEFELVSPEKLLVSEQVEMVVVPGTEGLFAAMPRHAPFISTLAPGVLEIYEGGSVKDRIFVAGGFAEVNETRCTVLAEDATPVEEIDKAGLQARIEELDKEIKFAESDAEREAAESKKKSAETKLAFAD
ncbi:MAG: F0F1 ATP synthase subunit epsilon [Alphaproteobacteria bacterium]|nr:F0F1 ATP synthase subunit epsilon [Alphaproteobacteria bacterium]